MYFVFKQLQKTPSQQLFDIKRAHSRQQQQPAPKLPKSLAITESQLQSLEFSRAPWTQANR
ncbi:GH23266 [Drosophila grimshawi]|uniref:GH23266 n=1 Tax=Drosophila grimshawi TaxID=7222 RepID=B4JTH4_DROGR|nr:GH23266 [Drosophila grimshawi]